MVWWDRFVTLLQGLQWALFASFALVFFRYEIGQLITRTQRVEGEGGKWAVILGSTVEKKDDALPDSGETVITPQDVLEAFRRIPGLTEEDTKGHMADIHKSLLRNGVVTKRQLDDLVSSTDVLDTLGHLYVEELHRSVQSPIDASAVATWGAFLFVYGLRPHVIDAIRRDIRRSPEGRLTGR